MTMRLLALMATIALAACGVAPAVPDFTYFRLPPPQSLQRASAPLFGDTLVVDAFSADGLYGDQALIYALDPGAQQLRQYHYQLWTDPPTRILQRRWIVQLRDANAATEVTDDLPASHPAIRISGIILRLDRVPTPAGGFDVVVALKLRADGTDGVPLVDAYYRADAPAVGSDLNATVSAYGVALDKIFATFYTDLRQHGGSAHAR
ncbi:MAG: ABC-type transport auxiliary lipoprotein family protein [Dokdonella sp.]